MSTTTRDAKNIFLEAVENRSPNDWPAFLDEACGDDRELRERVEGLLQAHAEKDSLFDRAAPTADYVPLERAGQMIGPYKLRERLGTGGMGVVWAAEQQKPLRRKVALKVIKPGMDSEQVLARFEAEREALALMDHPNIARVLDAGTTDQGRPYFVMELIRGVPITQYCDAKKLTVRERLALFMQVCRAVQHAHQKGIIHRDLKPSNVLVSEQDGQPVPKVIDFGVAKALHQRLTDRSVYTGVFQAIGTLAYMSPEQAGLSVSDIDTRADIYSLGILLYELLTGSTPFDKDDLASAAFDEACRIIREQDPPKPSTRISTLGNRAAAISLGRNTDPEGLAKTIRGDLDWIVIKSLDKDRTRRYETAGGFAADVERFLQDDVIEARPPSVAYRLRKQYLRNRALMNSIGVISLLLIGATAVSTYFAVVATRAKNELEVVLHDLWEVIYDHALDATFSGDLAEALTAIERAEKAKAPKNLTETLRGLALFTSGDTGEAIKSLESVAGDYPTDIAVQSALSWAYYHDNQPGKHERNQERLRTLLTNRPSEYTVYENFFICLEAFVDGSEEELQTHLERINSVIEEKRQWGAAYALRAIIVAELAMDRHSLDVFADAIGDVEKALERLPESTMVLSNGLYVLQHAIALADSEREPREEWKRQAAALASRIDETTRESLAIQEAAVYYYGNGNHDVATSLENELLLRTEEGLIVSTVEHTGYDKARIPFDEWMREKENTEKQLCLAIALAFDHPTVADANAARRIVRDVLDEKPAAAFYVIAMDVAKILGDDALAAQIISSANQSGALDRDYRWWKLVMLYHDRQLDEDALLAKAEPFYAKCSLAYYAIAMRALAQRKLDVAEEYFEKTVNLRTPSFYTYHNAKVFLKRLNADPNWPKSTDVLLRNASEQR